MMSSPKNARCLLPALLLLVTHAAVANPWNMRVLETTPKFTMSEVTDGVREVYYESIPFTGKPQRVFAWYATPGSLAGNPELDKNLPALVLIHGGGGTAWKSWVKLWAGRGYAAIAMDLGGRGPDKVRLPDGGPDDDGKRKILDLGKPMEQQWPYHAVANVIVANSLLRSLPEIDKDKIGVGGSSWGGFLTCIAAGVDHRFAAAASVYGCGFVSENSIWVDMGLFKEAGPESIERWNKWWDPAGYLPQVKCPILFASGSTDFAYPLESWAKSTSLVQAPLYQRLTHSLPHSDDVAWTVVETAAFFDAILKSGPPPNRLGNTVESGGQVTAEILGPARVVSAALLYTAETGVPNKDRKWIPWQARPIDGKIVASSPPPEAKAYFLTGLTEDNYTISSTPVMK